MLNVAQALGQLPQGLRGELLSEYNEIIRNFREGRWKATELDGGRFAEVVYSILSGYLNGGNYPASAAKPPDLKKSCEDLGRTPKSEGPDSIRITVPRVLIALYQIRNNRNVGHIGGDVSANRMDATYVLQSAQWVMAELVRIFHDTDVEAATSIVGSLVDRTLPVVWKIGYSRRLLDTSLSVQDSILLLLYSEAGGIVDRELASDLEKRPENVRKVLRKLHVDRLIEFRNAGDTALLSPKGIKYVEETLLG